MFKGQGKRFPASVLLCLTMLFTGLLVCFLTILIYQPDKAVHSFLTLFSPFDGLKAGVLEDRIRSLCLSSAGLYLCVLGVIAAASAGTYYTGFAAQCLAGIGVFSFAQASTMPVWAAWLCSIIAGALLGSLRGCLVSGGREHAFFSGLALDFLFLFLAPLIPTGRSFSAGSVFQSRTGMISAAAIAVVCGVSMYVFLYRSRAGYEVRAAEHNMRAFSHRVQGSAWIGVAMMALSGGLISAGAALALLQGTQPDAFACVSFALSAVCAGCLALYHPIGALFSSLAFQYFALGSAGIADHPSAAMLPELFSAAVILVFGLWKRTAHNRSIRGLQR